MTHPIDVTQQDLVLRFGRYQDRLRRVTCDLLCTDTPYSKRTHEGHDTGAETANKRNRPMRASGVPDTGRERRAITYDYWTPADVFEFVFFWRERCRGWWVCMTDSELWPAWRAALDQIGLVTFQPVVINIPGMTVRMTGDGPSSWCIHVAVARPRGEPFSKWGTLPGSYTGPVGPSERAESAVAGAKPLWACRALVRDYSRPGDLVADPCMGGGTIPLAAAIEGRRAIGAEPVESTFAAARKKVERGFTPTLDFGRAKARTSSDAHAGRTPVLPGMEETA